MSGQRFFCNVVKVTRLFYGAIRKPNPLSQSLRAEP